MSEILKSKILFLVFVALLLFPAKIFSADVFFESKNKEFILGEDFLVEFYLDARSEPINAIEGKIAFDDSMLEIVEIKDGNSSINFWVDKPNNLAKGAITFSGVTPGGLYNKNLLFGVVFRPKKIGEGIINLDEIQALKNDGNGSKVQVKKSQFAFLVYSARGQSSGQSTSTLSDIIDNNPPEDFKPEIGKDPEIFNGEYFLVFATQDKGVGMDHYEVKEGFWGKYSKAESPYLIKNQSLTKKIYVKAVDRSLNERIVSIKSQNTKQWYELYALLGIIILFIASFVFKKRWLNLKH